MGEIKEIVHMNDQDLLGITKRSIQGVIALISRQFILQLISVTALVVISVRLSPRDYGIYTAVIAIQRVISFFTDFGLGAALVQKKDKLEPEDITTTFTIQFLVTLFILVLILFLKGFIGSFFKLDQAGLQLLLVLVLCIFLSSFKIIPSILLEREIKFHRLIIPQIVESLTFNIILVTLLLKNLGISSYTYAFLVSAFIGIPIYYYIRPWRINFGISTKSLSHIKYGTQFQAKNILATLKDDFLTLFLVRFLSFTQIGYIGFAQRWAFIIFRFIVDSVTKVTFSTYSRMQANRQYLETAIEKSLFYVSFVMFPVLTGIMIIFPFLVAYIPKWHNKWEPAIISLTFFCLNAAVSSLSGILVNVLDATGNVRKTLQLMIYWTILTWVLTPLSIYFFGYNGVAAASFLVTLTIFYTIYLVHKIVPFNFIASVYKPFVSSLIMGTIVFSFSHILVTNVESLVFGILIGGTIYLFSIFLLARDELYQGINIVLHR
jgi:O-antigen/teichoic acid export membrane protein